MKLGILKSSRYIWEALIQEKSINTRVILTVSDGYSILMYREGYRKGSLTFFQKRLHKPGVLMRCEIEQ